MREVTRKSEWNRARRLLPPALIGMGLVLFPIHNRMQPGLEFAFLPVVGLAFIVIGAALTLLKEDIFELLGPKAIWIPLAVIVGFLGANVIVTGWEKGAASLAFGLAAFALYLASRKWGQRVFLVFFPAVAVQIVWVIVQTAMGQPAGGYVTSPDLNVNYQIASGFIIFGILVSRGKWQWVVFSFGLLAVGLTQSREALVALVIVVLVIIGREDYSTKAALPLLTGLVMVMSLFMLELNAMPGASGSAQGTSRVALPYTSNLMERWQLIVSAFADISFFGHGFSLTEFNSQTVHNVPVVIMQQIGVIPALCWLWITFYCLWKTPYKYAWAGIIGLSIFDHYIWTQAAVWWWALVGASSVGTKRDYIFKDEPIRGADTVRVNNEGDLLQGTAGTGKQVAGYIQGDTGGTGEVKP